ncbi:MAG: uroporphyrinogen decarboxylase family protein [Actinomycetota bacterium]
MDAEERLYAALDGRQPDRPPTISMSLDPNITNQALGRGPNGLLELLESERGSRFVDRHAQAINRFFTPAALFFYDVSARANHIMGFDAVWFGYWRMRLRDHAHIQDAFGRLMDIVDDGFGNAYFMYREGLINSAEEWRAWPRPVIARYATTAARVYRVLRARWRNRIAIIPFLGPGPWENSWQPMGFAPFVTAMRKDPAFAREVTGYNVALTLACVDAYCAAGARVLTMGEDLAYRSGSMLSPEMLEEFYGEGYRQITATAHRYGAKIAIHCCGNTTDLVEKFVEWGFDGAHAFEPTAGNDLAAARAKVGDRLCLIGNIDITHTLVDGTREEVTAEVERAVHNAAGGGYILSPTHTHPSMSVERIRWMLEAARS